MQKKALRQSKISFNVPPQMQGGTISFDKDTGRIVIIGLNGNLIHPQGLVKNYWYEGENKKKCLSKLVAGPKFPLNGIDDLDFLATYDLIYIVDTNCFKTEDGKDHRLTSFLRCSVHDAGETYEVDMYERVGYFHFVNLKHEAAEKAGWVNLINHDFFREDLKKGTRIALIVDAYADQLESYNSKVKPITDNHFLPDNVTLMYARADKRDTIVNKLIQACDKLKDEYEQQFLEGKTHFPPQESPFFECEKYWFLNDKRDGLCIDPNVILKPKLVYEEGATVELIMHGVNDEGDQFAIKKKVI